MRFLTLFFFLMLLSRESSAFFPIVDVAKEVVPIDKVIENLKEGFREFMEHRGACNLVCQEKRLNKSCKAISSRDMSTLARNISEGNVGPVDLVRYFKGREIGQRKGGAIGRFCKAYCQTEVQFWLPKNYKVILKVRFREKIQGRSATKRLLGIGKEWSLDKCVSAYNSDPHVLYNKILKDKGELKSNIINIEVYNPYQLNSVLALIKAAAKLNPNALGEGVESVGVSGEGLKLESGELQFNENLVEIKEETHTDPKGQLIKKVYRESRKVYRVDPKEETRKLLAIIEQLQFQKKIFESQLLPNPRFTFNSDSMKEAMDEIDAPPLDETPDPGDLKKLGDEAVRTQISLTTRGNRPIPRGEPIAEGAPAVSQEFSLPELDYSKLNGQQAQILKRWGENLSIIQKIINKAEAKGVDTSDFQMDVRTFHGNLDRFLKNPDPQNLGTLSGEYRQIFEQAIELQEVAGIGNID